MVQDGQRRFRHARRAVSHVFRISWQPVLQQADDRRFANHGPECDEFLCHDEMEAGEEPNIVWRHVRSWRDPDLGNGELGWSIHAGGFRWREDQWRHVLESSQSKLEISLCGDAFG